jgi:hypothetical protein
MPRIVLLTGWTLVATVFAFLVLWTGGVLTLPGAVVECLRPTTIQGNYLPRGCVATDEAAPSGLTRIVDSQKALYHLEIQRVVVCKTTYRVRELEARYPGLPLPDIDPCLRLAKGCCSCQFGRHVIAAAAEPTATGSVVIHANLIQSRRDYLRRHWNRGHGSPLFWWLAAVGALILLLGLWKMLRIGGKRDAARHQPAM